MKQLIITLLLTLAASLSTSACSSDVLTYAAPESVGMDGEYLTRTIDSIITQSIENRCFPGCQIVVARRGKIVLHKSYGHHTYEADRIVGNDHLYDMASCTKVLTATLCMMRLAEQKQVDLDKPFSHYFKEFRGSNKEDVTLREFLTHQGGLTAIRHSRIILDEKRKLRSDILCHEESEAFPHKFGDSLFVCREIQDSIFNRIADLECCPRKFRYSCLSFHCYPAVIERLTGQRFEKYLYDEFYKPLGVKKAVFNPRDHYSLLEIVPTEVDEYFGRGLVHGYVHDEMAALLGGISGNAGLFANAESIAPIMQMLLNHGEYNGTRYFKRRTVREWTSCQYPENENHRGIGFDKRRLNDTIPIEMRTQKALYYAPSASKESFGHSGFTGTMVWADPKEDLIFIFLSNRVHPSRSEKSFFEQNPRVKCHEAAYEAIRRYKRR